MKIWTVLTFLLFEKKLLTSMIKIALYGICHSQEISPSTYNIIPSKGSIVETHMFVPIVLERLNSTLVKYQFFFHKLSFHRGQGSTCIKSIIQMCNLSKINFTTFWFQKLNLKNMGLGHSGSEPFNCKRLVCGYWPMINEKLYSTNPGCANPCIVKLIPYFRGGWQLGLPLQIV